MAGSPEAMPQGPEQYNLQETPMAAQRAANFQYLYDAFVLNRDGEQSQELVTIYYQEYLLTDRHGIATSAAFHKLTSDPEKEKLIHFAIYQMSLHKDDTYIDQLLDAVAEILPPELSRSILEDPHLADVA